MGIGVTFQSSVYHDPEARLLDWLDHTSLPGENHVVQEGSTGGRTWSITNGFSSGQVDGY